MTASTAKAPSAKQNLLERGRAQLAQVKRDPAKRRYRHHWEKAIRTLEKGARGADRAPALLDAARARYALYRFSQIEADREAAVRLAVRADRAGSREAAALVAAIRKEMGEDEESPRAVRASSRKPPPAAPRPASAGAGTSGPPATPSAPAEPPAPAPATAPAHTAPPQGDEDVSADPVLQSALTTAAEGGDTAEQPRAARVTDLKSWSNSDYTRVAIYLSKSVGYSKEEIPATGEHPRRLALDFRPASLERAFAHSVRDAMVQRVRVGQHDPETVRVVLDLAGRNDLTIFRLDDPPRLIVDVGVREARDEVVASAMKNAGAPRENKEEAEVASELEPRKPVRRIVIDAGHGGHDPGAIGPTRVREKDVTLAMAKRLAAQLRTRGFETVLTRTDDRYLSLEERTAIANARRGDLFISLHANAHPRREKQGIETYVLNMADNRYAARLAARENGALSDDDGGGAMLEVRRILSDLDAKSSSDSSRRLARQVQRELCAGIRGRFGEVRDLGVKSALFHVLIGARMPAVLVETSFISNRSEERRLRDGRFQEEVATSVARAVEGFAAREARLAAAR